jgi:hypothetical protein
MRRFFFWKTAGAGTPSETHLTRVVGLPRVDGLARTGCPAVRALVTFASPSERLAPPWLLVHATRTSRGSEPPLVGFAEVPLRRFSSAWAIRRRRRRSPGATGKQVPPSWFCTTSTVFHAHELRACCIPLPTMGFVAFVPRDAFHTPRRIARQQPHRVTAAVAFLWFHSDPADAMGSNPHPIARVRTSTHPPMTPKRHAGSRQGSGHFKALLHRRVGAVPSPLRVKRPLHSFHWALVPFKVHFIRVGLSRRRGRRGLLPEHHIARTRWNKWVAELRASRSPTSRGLRGHPSGVHRVLAEAGAPVPSESVRSRSWRRTWPLHRRIECPKTLGRRVAPGRIYDLHGVCDV